MKAPHILIAAALLALGAAGVASADDHTGPAAPATAQSTAAELRFQSYIMDANKAGMTLTNYGFVGNNFVARQPSFEYPLGTGYEHLIRGGLWIGGRAVDERGEFIGVTTAAVDGSTGSSSQGATEFTPASLVQVRSKLTENVAYDPAAVSERDVITFWDDLTVRRAAGSIEDHRPLRVQVRQENYAWSFSEYANFVVFRYIIKNLGPTLHDVWVGHYDEFASGPKNQYSSWPPSSAGSGGLGSWFSKKEIGYEDSLKLFTERFCAANPVPTGCRYSITPYVVGLKLLGATRCNSTDTTTYGRTLASWTYSPGSSLRDEDVERYAIMSAGTVTDLSVPELQPVTGDPVSLFAVGPYATIATGDSIEVDYAILGGTDPVHLRTVARFAQRAYQRCYVVPVPPPSPKMKVVSRNNALDLYWEESPEFFEDITSPVLRDFEGYRIYMSEDRTDLRLVAQYDKSTAPNDTVGFNTGFSAVRLPTPVVIDGRTYHYKYTLDHLKNGFKYFVAVTSYDLGNSEIESLESGQTQNKTFAIPAPTAEEARQSGVTVFPNPYRVDAAWDYGRQARDHYLWFANLPQRCKLKIFSLSGDLVYETDFNGATYTGTNASGVYDPSRELDVKAPVLSGSMYGWNMVTREGQAAATGLYMWAVEDAETGKRQVGKFLLVKSDREGAAQ